MESLLPLEPCITKRLVRWATSERFDYQAFSLYGSIPCLRAAGFYVIVRQMSIILLRRRKRIRWFNQDANKLPDKGPK
jgi:hypothetical protein